MQMEVWGYVGFDSHWPGSSGLETPFFVLSLIFPSPNLTPLGK